MSCSTKKGAYLMKLATKLRQTSLSSMILVLANFLVVVTDVTGAPVITLSQANFFIGNQFSLPGQVCGFSNNIVSFVNVGNGAYRIQVGLAVNIPGCHWVEG